MLASSTAMLGGIAADPEGIIKLLIGNGGWNFVKNEFGDSSATAIGPGFAIAAADKGESANAFALGGLAIATTDITIFDILGFKGFKIPTGQASCIGVVAFATSSTDGMCLNLLGTVDADYRTDAGEVSLGVTNPLALIGLLTGDKDLLGLIKEVVAGKPLSRILTDDFARITLGGTELVKLTSDYAFSPLSAYPGAIALGWLGGQLVLFPTITNGILKGNVNYLGVPALDFSNFGKLDNISSLIPSLSVGQFKTPIPGVTIPELSTGDLLSPQSTSSVNPNALSRTADVPELAADPAPQVPAEAPVAPELPMPTDPGAPTDPTVSTPVDDAPAPSADTTPSTGSDAAPADVPIEIDAAA